MDDSIEENLPSIRPGPKPNRSKNKRYDCSFCARSFGRFEHLDRHERIHTNEKPYPCTLCPKRFARKDLLARHGKAMHHATEPATTENHAPDSSQMQVTPPVNSLRNAEWGQPQEAGSIGHVTDEMITDVDSSSRDELMQNTIRDYAASNHSPYSLAAGYQKSNDGVSSGVHTTQGTLGAAGPPQYSGTDLSGMPNVPNTDINSIQSGSVVPQQDSVHGALFNSIWDTRLFDFPWMEDLNFTATATSMPTDTTQPLWSMPKNGPTQFQHIDQRHHQLRGHGNNMYPERLNETASNPNETSNTMLPNNVWSDNVCLLDKMFSRRPSPKPERALPLSPHSARASSRLATQVRSHLISQLEPLLEVIPTGFFMPSQHALVRYIAGYFNGFHLHLPFIHVPTWSPITCKVPLLLAICALGAKYSFEKDVATMLWEVARLLVRQETEKRGGVKSTSTATEIETCQALLLLMAFQTWTGDPFLLRQALSFQSTLAGLVRLEELKAWPKLVDMEWRDWVQYEGSKRTRLVIYCFFNLQHLAYNIPPLILNREVRLDLPSDEESWRAEDEDAWDKAGRGQASGTPYFQHAIRRLLSEGEYGGSIIDDSSSNFRELLPYSTFGSYILIHGLIQHHFHLRQLSGLLTKPDGSVDTDVEHGLSSWKQGWETNPEASLDPKNPHGPVAFNCTPLLRIAYIRLEIDFGPVCTALQSGDPQIIAHSIRHECTIARGPRLTMAALHSCHALLILVKEGIDLVAHTQVFIWSIQHAIVSFQCCLTLVKWLDAVTVDAPNPPISGDERWLVRLVQEALEECNTKSTDNVKGLSTSVLRVWAKVFTGTTIWGIMPVMGAALNLYAEISR